MEILRLNKGGAMKEHVLEYKEIVKLNNINYSSSLSPFEKDFNESKEKIFSFLKKQKDKSEIFKIIVLINKYHCGMRLGDKIPEIQHLYDIVVDLIKWEKEIKIAGIDILEVIKVALLHDIFEDYRETAKIWFEDRRRMGALTPLSFELFDLIIEDKVLIDRVLSLSKFKTDGVQKKSKHYYRGLKKEVVLILVKTLDRKNSLSTMKDVFSEDKKLRYIKQYLKEIKPIQSFFSKKEEVELFYLINNEIETLITSLLKDKK